MTEDENRQNRRQVAETDRQTRAEQTAAALRLRREGLTLRAIGDRLGVGKDLVAKLVGDALADPVKTAARDYRIETHEWIDKVRTANSEQLDSPAAANVVLRATENVARLEGLYTAPTPTPTAAAAWATAQVIIEHRDGSFSAGNRGEVIDETRNHIVVRDDMIPPPTRDAGETWAEYAARCVEVGREPPPEDTWNGPRDIQP